MNLLAPQVIGLFTFVINAIILIVVLLLNKEELLRIRKLIDILTNGGYRDCPLYKEKTLQGLRKSLQENDKKGGETL